ncbi:MAG: porin family protein [Bacteroidaceae bacterium]
MKKIYTLIFLFLCLTFSSFSAFGQVGKALNDFKLGVNGGINLNKMSFQPEIKQSYLMGESYGISARYIHEKYFALICGIQGEINYTQRGWSEAFSDEGDSRGYKHTMTYVEIPFLAHLALAFNKDSGSRFFINAGPQVAFLLDEKSTFSGTWTEEQITAREDPDNYISNQYRTTADNDFDYGIVGGVGVDIATGIGRFCIEGRYYYSLSDIYSNAKKNYFDRSAHTDILFKLTYFFSLF